jgi:hypothetical protein
LHDCALLLAKEAWFIKLSETGKICITKEPAIPAAVRYKA